MKPESRGVCIGYKLSDERNSRFVLAFSWRGICSVLEVKAGFNEQEVTCPIVSTVRKQRVIESLRLILLWIHSRALPAERSCPPAGGSPT